MILCNLEIVFVFLSLQDMKLNDAMMTALIQNRTDFVRLFMDNGVELKDFLDIKNLWNLYANVSLHDFTLLQHKNIFHTRGHM